MYVYLQSSGGTGVKMLLLMLQLMNKLENINVVELFSTSDVHVNFYYV